MLKHVSDTVQAVPHHTRHEWAPWDAFVFVEDPDGLGAELRSRGLELPGEVTDPDDGLRGFQVRDPDGYVLCFGRRK